MPKIIVTIDRDNGADLETAEFEVTAAALAQIVVWRQKDHRKVDGGDDYLYKTDVEALRGNLEEAVKSILVECPTDGMLQRRRELSQETNREVKRVLART